MKFRSNFVLLLALGQLVSWGSLYYSFAVIAPPMGAELGWSRSAAAALLLLAWSQISELWQLFAVWIAMGVVLSTVLYEPVFAVMARELKNDYRRGIIIITLLGGLASTVFIPLTHVLEENLGWRGALQVLALIQIPLGVVLHWLVLRNGEAKNTPNPANLAPKGRVRRAIRTPVFWLLAVSYAAHSFMFTAVSFNILPLLTERGFAMAAAVLAFSLVGPAQVSGRIAIYALERRIKVTLAGTIATVLPVLGIACLMLSVPGAPLLYVFAILYGTGMGIKTIVQATAAPEFLGREGYGALKGTFAGINYAVQAATPFATALLWQATGRYDEVLWLLFAVTSLSAAAFALAVLLRPKDVPALVHGQ